MAKKYDWDKIRAEYEVGKTMSQLSREYGVDKAAISRRAKKEHWIQDVRDEVKKRVYAKVNGEMDNVDLLISAQDREKAIEKYAQEKADIILLHRKELQKARGITLNAVNALSFDQIRIAKIFADTIRIIQDGERKAWQLDEKEEEETKEYSNFDDLTTEELEQLEVILSRKSS